MHTTSVECDLPTRGVEASLDACLMVEMETVAKELTPREFSLGADVGSFVTKLIWTNHL